jgi:hypothetical protein
VSPGDRRAARPRAWVPRRGWCPCHLRGRRRCRRSPPLATPHPLAPPPAAPPPQLRSNAHGTATMARATDRFQLSTMRGLQLQKCGIDDFAAWPTCTPGKITYYMGKLRANTINLRNWHQARRAAAGRGLRANPKAAPATAARSQALDPWPRPAPAPLPPYPPPPHFPVNPPHTHTHTPGAVPRRARLAAAVPRPAPLQLLDQVATQRVKLRGRRQRHKRARVPQRDALGHRQQVKGGRGRAGSVPGGGWELRLAGGARHALEWPCAHAAARHCPEAPPLPHAAARHCPEAPPLPHATPPPPPPGSS